MSQIDCCKYCGSVALETFEQKFKTGELHKGKRCKDCGRGLGWLPKENVDVESWVIPFGKYKGETLAEVYETDQGYVEWLADKCEGTAQKRAEKLLELRGDW